ncbi:hypothetical protein Tco_0343328 [Tanacetum coccineum]
MDACVEQGTIHGPGECGHFRLLPFRQRTVRRQSGCQEESWSTTGYEKDFLPGECAEYMEVILHRCSGVLGSCLPGFDQTSKFIIEGI